MVVRLRVACNEFIHNPDKVLRTNLIAVNWRNDWKTRRQIISVKYSSVKESSRVESCKDSTDRRDLFTESSPIINQVIGLAVPRTTCADFAGYGVVEGAIAFAPPRTRSIYALIMVRPGRSLGSSRQARRRDWNSSRREPRPSPLSLIEGLPVPIARRPSVSACALLPDSPSEPLQTPRASTVAVNKTPDRLATQRMTHRAAPPPLHPATRPARAANEICSSVTRS